MACYNATPSAAARKQSASFGAKLDVVIVAHDSFMEDAQGLEGILSRLGWEIEIHSAGRSQECEMNDISL